VIWTNRFPVSYLEGLEDLIQDPHKMLDEVNGRRFQVARYVNAGDALDCRQPERCVHCFIEPFCTTMDRVIEKQRTEAFEIYDVGTGTYDAALPMPDANVMLGAASVLAEQPEFSGADRLRRLLALTETPQALGDAIRKRIHAPGISITIGAEHDDPRFEDFTVVTAEYHVGALAGVIGVIGPTRMPYDKVISLVSHTSQLLSDLLD
jgi:hypothetical protein